jgi:hypothetical protein
VWCAVPKGREFREGSSSTLEGVVVNLSHATQPNDPSRRYLRMALLDHTLRYLGTNSDSALGRPFLLGDTAAEQ